MKDPGKPGLPPGGGMKIFLAVLLILGGIGLAAYAFASRADAVNSGARTAVTIVGIVFGIGLPAAAYAILRTVFPPHAKHLKISVPVTEVKRGGDVEVRLEVANPEKAAENLELGLVCDEYYDVETTDGQGNSNRSTRQVRAYEDWRPQSAGPLQAVRFPVPANAPYSYRGDCLSYVWRVSAREPRRLRFDRTENVLVVVRP